MFGNVHPLGFLGTPKARDAEFLIGQTQHLVVALDPTGTNLKPAQEALNAAKALHAAQEYAKAVAQAERAANLAVILNDRFMSYLAAWKELQACQDELREIGIPTDGLEATLAAADKEVVRLVDEDGARVPNYVGALDAMERAIRETRTLVAQAREASQEIFFATLAAEALSESPSKRVPSETAARIEQMVEQATRELAGGHIAAAQLIATEARARGDAALAGAGRAWDRIDMVTAILDGLGAEGPLVDELAMKVHAAKEALARGVPDRASAHAVVLQVSEDVASFAKHYPPDRKLLETAERVYTSLQREGFVSPGVNAALGEARVALGNGAWATVRERVAGVSETFVRLRRDQQTIGRAVADLDERVSLLKGFPIPVLPRIEEVLDRVRQAARSGRISAANADLVFAGALMAGVTRTGS